MLKNINETQKLFAKTVPVTIKDGYTNHCRNSKLSLTVEWKEASTAIHRQELLISLTDNNDPFFLYHLHISEEDFQVLKTSQGLLIDFSAFPQKFIDLIEVCLAEENKATPKFLMVFNANEKVGSIASTSQLDVVETNPFKHLTHLSLKFVAATDSSIKQYLAVCFKNLKEEKRQLEQRLNYLEQDLKDKLSTSEATLDQKGQELELVRKDLSVQLSMKESRHARELQEEREKFLSKQREEELRSDKERKEKEHNFRKEIQQLEARVSCLDTLNKELQDQNHKRDNTIRELRSRVLSLEEETKRNKESARDYKEQNEVFQTEIREKRLQLTQLKDKINELEGEITYKKQMTDKLQEQYERQHKQEKALENELAELKNQFHKCIKASNKYEEDLIKANDVIEKCQRETQAIYEKLKHSNLLTAKQERSISEKEKLTQILQKELKDIKLDMKKKSNEVKSLTDSVASLQEKSNSLEKEIKARDNVIKYLNRQLTDRCIIPQYLPPSNLGVSPTGNSQALKMNSAGDPGIVVTNHSPTVLGTEKPKTLHTRNGNYSPLQNMGIGSPAQLQVTVATVDSAYASSPSCNTKDTTNSPGDVHSNAVNFELDSAALSAAFGSGQLLKHSTAKKPTPPRTTTNLEKFKKNNRK